MRLWSRVQRREKDLWKEVLRQVSYSVSEESLIRVGEKHLWIYRQFEKPRNIKFLF